MRYHKLFHDIFHYIELRSDLDDMDTIYKTIEKDVVFKGTNLWILVFAIFVASVGLNMNSTAVIIGAMLISPLMGPINGMGYSIATYNFPLFRKSVKNYSFAVIAGLLASTLYFTVTPISTAHSELLARTNPTIYDVLIALFGGLAGIVATTSKQKGNVIPGVAIATALMPPLCTAGYGLATLQLNYFFGALYLFTINTVFIGIATLTISQILKFPIITLVDNAQKVKVNRWISFVITLVLIPSIYFGYLLVQKETFYENANKFVNNVSIVEGNFLLKHEIDPNKRKIILVYGGTNLTDTQKQNIIGRTEDFTLKKVDIEFHQGLSFDEFSKKNTLVDELRLEINQLNMLIKQQQHSIDSLQIYKLKGKELLSEIQVLYPEIMGCSYAETYMFVQDTSAYKQIPIVVFKADINKISKEDMSKIRNWVNVKLKNDDVKIYFE